MAKVIFADVSHIEPIAERMREADKTEIWLSSKQKPYQALQRSLAQSERTYTIIDGSDPIGMFGVGYASILGQTGTPWLLGTDGILDIRREFMRQAPYFVNELQQGFFRLFNFVHADNAVSIRWLKGLGFTIMPKVKAGPFSAWFHPFERIDDVQSNIATDSRHRDDDGRDGRQRHQSGQNS